MNSLHQTQPAYRSLMPLGRCWFLCFLVVLCGLSLGCKQQKEEPKEADSQTTENQKTEESKQEDTQVESDAEQEKASTSDAAHDQSGETSETSSAPEATADVGKSDASSGVPHTGSPGGGRASGTTAKDAAAAYSLAVELRKAAVAYAKKGDRKSAYQATLVAWQTVRQQRTNTQCQELAGQLLPELEQYGEGQATPNIKEVLKKPVRYE